MVSINIIAFVHRDTGIGKHLQVSQSSRYVISYPAQLSLANLLWVQWVPAKA